MPFKPTVIQDEDSADTPPNCLITVKIRDFFTRLPFKFYVGLGVLLLLTCLSVLGLISYRRFPNLLTSAEPLSQEHEALMEATPTATLPQEDLPSSLESPQIFNILILGIDRRHPQDTSYRSDVNLVVSFSADRKKILLTSIPRDLWVDGSRINAFISTEGPEAMKNKVAMITGLTIDRYFQIDFDGLVEAVDAMGGIDVEIPVGFSDSDYPNDRAGLPGVMTVTFDAGLQHLNGEKALIYSRSRKGSNGEGSDFRRSARQQNLMKAMPAAFLSPKCIFNPFVVQNFYARVVDKYQTDFTLEDVRLAYELLKTYQQVTVDNLVLQPPTYLYQPDPDEYGGAYVLRPLDESFKAIHEVIRQKIQ